MKLDHVNEPGRQACRQADKQADKQVGRHVDKQAGRQTGWKEVRNGRLAAGVSFTTKLFKPGRGR